MSDPVQKAVDDYIDMVTVLPLLREVHEAARQFLRFRGIDKERQDAALVRLVDAMGAVKDYDATAG
jgi:hypothetical protein